MKFIIALFTFVIIYSCSTETSVDLEKELNVAQKSHPVLPNLIHVHLKDKDGHVFHEENVVCKLNFNVGMYTYKFMALRPVDSEGVMTLTKDQILKYTGLKSQYDSNLPVNSEPIEFELSVINPIELERIVEEVKVKIPELGTLIDSHSNKEIDDEEFQEKLANLNTETRGSFDIQVIQPDIDLNTKFEDLQTKVIGKWDKESDYTYEVTLK